MSTPKATAPNTQQSTHSIGALILIVLTAIAIIVALILGGIRLFGQDTEHPTGDPTENPSINPFDPDFKVEAWPSDQPLSSYGLLSGTLLIPTADYTPSADSLQTIDRRNESGIQFELSGTGLQIDKAANEALLRMLTAMNSALSFDESISVHTAYSTLHDVDYRTGMTVRFRLKSTVDDSTKFLNEATGDNPVTWFEQNAWKYGFVLRYPKGNAIEGKENGVSDVYRYVGIPHAYYITKVLELEDEAVVPTLEDYLVLVKKATAKNPVAFSVSGSGTDDGVYNVYYVAAKDVDGALLREGAEIYGVSGDGSGYIVTSYIRTANAPSDNENSTEDSTEEST